MTTPNTSAPSRTTRDAILEAALALFSQKGFEASSMREIAAGASITQGAIYKHFANKEDLLGAICSLMEANDAEHAGASGVPAGEPEAGAPVSMTDFRAFTLDMFAYWANDELAAPFRRMLEIDRFRTERMQGLFRQYLGAGPLEYTRGCLAAAGVDGAEARGAALSLWGTFRLLLELVDAKELSSIEATDELAKCLAILLPSAPVATGAAD